MAAVLALPVAALLFTLLRRGTYRYPDEAGTPVPRPWWLWVALPASWYLLTALHAATPWTLVFLLGWVTLLTGLAVVDLDVHRLPDAVQLPAMPLVAVGAAAAGLVEHSAADALRAVLAAAVLGVAFFALFLVGRGALGLGDVKLAVILGAALGLFGWGPLLTGAVLGPFLAALYAVPAMVLGRRHRKDYMPLGPSLMLGAVLAVLPAGL